MSVSHLALMAGLALFACGVAPVMADPCSNPLPVATAATGTPRSVAPRDLVELRDIGPDQIDDPSAKLFDISPDGQSIAFQMQQGRADANIHCLSLVVVPLHPGGPATVLNQGGQFIKRYFESEGYTLGGILGGIPRETQPLWSPDGQRLAFLRRDNGVTQVWVATLSGSARAITQSPVDVDAFAWDPTGKGIVISTRPGLAAFDRDVEAEGKAGYLYDERWVPGGSDHPLPRGIYPTAYSAVDTNTGAVTVATPEQTRLISRADPLRPADSVAFAAAPNGDVAWTAPVEQTDVLPAMGLNIKWGGQVKHCLDGNCTHIVSLWWAPDGSLVFLRREGVPTGRMAIYRWRRGAAAPDLVLSTRSYLIGCQMNGGVLYCREDGALQPGRLVSIGVPDGHVSAIYDPNPEFTKLKLGSVERINWTNNIGIETWGDLVLPPDHKPGERLPLIMVQYTSNGFLRGGTGVEFPIQVFAAHGFAVLSIERPTHLGLTKHPKTWDEVNRIDMTDWADRWSVLSGFETAIHLLDKRGLIDPSRVGITGLSDGASSAQFAVVNSQLFRAAAISQCCEEESSPSMLAGPIFSEWHHKMGYPRLTEDGKAFWSSMSLRANAAKIDTPILMQLSDNEYVGALEGYVPLKDLNKPVEMYVFPDENHVKWQPAHRFAAYTRYTDWFDFWLQGKEDPDPAKAAQYKRWEAMRDQQKANAGTTSAQ